MSENSHSKRFELVKSYYEKKLWSIHAVSKAVENNWITAEEFKEITGIDYPV